MTASLSNLADTNAALNIQAVPGFRYGNDALDNPTLPDPSLIGSAATATITPTLLTLTKTYVGPESETATGPNFPRQYTIGVSVAPGQVITNLDITDVLPNNMQFVRVDATTGNGGPTVTGIATPTSASAAPGGTLTRRYSTITGTGAATDAVLTFTFYIPEKDSAAASILPPMTGAFAPSLDTASSTGSWLPIDTRDRPASIVNSNTATHTLTDKSLAIQKSVADLTHPGAPIPGDTLEYTLQFQVSDYFAFDNTFFKDIISDGQHWDTTFTPTMQVNGNGFALVSGAISTANFTVAQNWTGATVSTAPFNAAPYTLDPATDDGKTTITFRVANEIMTRGRPDGKLVGGKLPATGGVIIPDTFPITSPQSDGPTTVTIVFRTVIQDKYTNDFPSGDDSLDPRDTVSNQVFATGDLLNNTTLLPYAGPVQVTDDSAATVVIVPTDLIKSIYAINGVVGTYTAPQISAGDTVTYRLEFTIPFGDIESLALEDYLPLPIFTATQVTAFDSLTPSATPPAAGFAHFKDTDTFFNQYKLVPNGAPTISYPANSNSLKFQYNTFDYAPNTPLKVDLLFTVTVSNLPFADKLFLTNQVQASEGTTNKVVSSQTKIVQIQLTEPVLKLVKGVVRSNDTRGTSPVTFAPTNVGPAGITFTVPGTAGVPFTGGTINSTNMTARPINSNATNVDANDLVTFIVTIENTGTGINGAFDITLGDSLPAGFQIPTSGSGLNLRVSTAPEPRLASPILDRRIRQPIF